MTPAARPGEAPRGDSVRSTAAGEGSELFDDIADGFDAALSDQADLVAVLQSPNETAAQLA